MKKVVISAAKRTAVGSFNGVLSAFSAPQLGAEVVKDLLSSTGLNPALVNEVISGNVISAGLGQAPARQVAKFAGLPDSVECMTINKMCGSGLKAVMLAQQAIAAGDADCIIAGGIESMSNAPYLLPKARNGYRLGHGQVLDSLIIDGLWDVYNNIHMGSCAEKCAKDFSMSREEVDNYAIMSYTRAQQAVKDGVFKDEITPLVQKSKTGDVVIDTDEEPEKVNFAKVPSLKPVFEKDGVVTAANASSLNDGAAMVIVSSEEFALANGLTPMVEIVSQSSHAQAPVDFTTAPAASITKAVAKAGLTLQQIDLFEINEAFAVVSIAVNKLLGITSDNVNVHGGAIALGHPIGASGARVLTTLLYEMKRRNSTYGVASLCIGGGEASAMVVKKYSGA